MPLVYARDRYATCTVIVLCMPLVCTNLVCHLFRVVTSDMLRRMTQVHTSGILARVSLAIVTDNSGLNNNIITNKPTTTYMYIHTFIQVAYILVVQLQVAYLHHTSGIHRWHTSAKI
eukprot:SAG31_NODE_401_length_16206_cov_10.920780_1_plen_117_part_00